VRARERSVIDNKYPAINSEARGKRSRRGPLCHPGACGERGMLINSSLNGRGLNSPSLFGSPFCIRT